jgi:hypothetical protein
MGPPARYFNIYAALPGHRAQWPIGSPAVFGSRVRDDAPAGSNLDGLVAFTQPIAPSPLLALEARLAWPLIPTVRDADRCPRVMAGLVPATHVFVYKGKMLEYRPAPA